MMEDIIVNINRKSRQVSLSKATIGNDGENLQGNFIFKFDEFVDGQARLEYTFENEETKKYITLEKQSDSYICPIKSTITKEGKIFMQLVITQGIDEEEIPIFKCNVYYVYCNGSINAVEEAPEGYEQWIDIANTKLNQMDNVDIDIKNVDENVMVEITRKDGTKKSAVVSGTGGTGGKVDDVLVDGVSVVNNKIANINLRERVIEILIEYDLLRLNELTEEQIQALNDMVCEINETGELIITYDEVILPINFALEGVNLVVTSNINALFGINKNGELEVSYESN